MIIDGKKHADLIAKNLGNFIKEYKIIPRLTIIQIGDNPASNIYIQFKQKKAKELEIESELIKLPLSIKTEELETIIKKLNLDKNVHGIIVQFPLPKHIDKNRIVCAINPNKDVDGFHPENFGKLSLGEKGLFSCTPMGCLHLIRSIYPDISGMNTVILGRSIIVGKPLSLLLINNNASVSVLHSYSKNITEFTQKADILIACTGKAGLITTDMVKKDAIIIDVGVTKLESGITIGDCDFDNLKNKVKAITPSIGGVGPMTIIMLLYNTIKAYCIQNNIKSFEEKCGNFT